MNDCTAWWCLSDAALRHLEVLGVWFGSAATFAAVVLALWLALRLEPLDLKAFATVGLTIRQGQLTIRSLWIHVTNTSIRPTVITVIGWENGWFSFGPWKRREALQSLGGAVGKLPATLHDGQSVDFKVPLTDDWWEAFVRDLLTPLPWFRLRTLKLIVVTSRGRTLRVRPEQSVIRELGDIIVRRARAEGSV